MGGAAGRGIHRRPGPYLRRQLFEHAGRIVADHGGHVKCDFLLALVRDHDDAAVNVGLVVGRLDGEAPLVEDVRVLFGAERKQVWVGERAER